MASSFQQTLMDKAKSLHKQIMDNLMSHPRSGEPSYIGMEDNYFDQETSVKQPVPSQASWESVGTSQRAAQE